MKELCKRSFFETKIVFYHCKNYLTLVVQAQILLLSHLWRLWKIHFWVALPSFSPSCWCTQRPVLKLDAAQKWMWSGQVWQILRGKNQGLLGRNQPSFYHDGWLAAHAACCILLWGRPIYNLKRQGVCTPSCEWGPSNLEKKHTDSHEKSNLGKKNQSRTTLKVLKVCQSVFLSFSNNGAPINPKV